MTTENQTNESTETPEQIMCASCAEEVAETNGMCTTCTLNYIDDYSEYL